MMIEKKLNNQGAFTIGNKTDINVGIAFPDHKEMNNDEIINLYNELTLHADRTYDRQSEHRRVLLISLADKHYLVSTIGDDNFQEIVIFIIEEEDFQEIINEAEETFEQEEMEETFMKELDPMKFRDFQKIGNIGFVEFANLFKFSILEAYKMNKVKIYRAKYLYSEKIPIEIAHMLQDYEDGELIWHLEKYYRKVRFETNKELLEYVRERKVLEDSITFLEEELEYFERNFQVDQDEDDTYQHIIEQMEIKGFTMAKEYLEETPISITLADALRTTIEYVENYKEDNYNV